MPDDRRSPAELDPAGLVRHVPTKPHDLVDPITRTENLFVLAHFGFPVMDIASWRLEVAGRVERPRTLSFQELLNLPSRTIEAIHQCSGFPRRHDIATRRIANVQWTGVDLRILLERSKAAEDVSYVWAYGYDEGWYPEITKPSAYVKDVPIKRVQDGDVLVAYALNGEPLSRANGFPVRLVVPGYYGTNSVKWLRRIELAKERHSGPFTTLLYNDPDSTLDRTGTVLRPVWEVGPEAIIVSPRNRARAGRQLMAIKGWAWGSARIDTVEVSTDGGTTWFRAAIEGRRQWSWQSFTASWQPEKSGTYKIMARAIDTFGVVQPMKRARNAVHRIFVDVE